MSRLMTASLRSRVGWILAGFGFALLAAWGTVRHGFAFNDYDLEAAASVGHLLDGDVAAFLGAAPSYGGSLVIRGPAVLIADGVGGGELAAYVALAVPGLLAVAVVAGLLAGAARRRGWSVWACLLVPAVAFLNPATTQALDMGHAEELLGAALCVGATMLAVGGRGVWAAVLLGLAVGNKQWAIVAVLPVLLALPAPQRLRAGIITAAVAGVVMAPLLLGGSAVQTTTAVATSSGGLAKPLQVWWFAGSVTDLPADSSLPAGTRAPAQWVSLVSRPLLVLVAALLSVAWWRLRRPLHTALGLLALVLLVRCLLDPWTVPYYHLPFLLALLAWETQTARHAPWATLAACAVLKGVLLLRPEISSDALSLAYCAVAVPGAVALALCVLAPGRLSRVFAAAARWRPAPRPADALSGPATNPH